MTAVIVERLVYFGRHHQPKWLKEECSSLPEVADGELLLRVLLATMSASDARNLSGTLQCKIFRDAVVRSGRQSPHGNCFV